MPRQIRPDNDYKDALLKLIPSEIVASYMCIDGVIPRDGTTFTNAVALGITVCMAALIYPFLKRFHHVHNRKQIILTIVGFCVWVFWLQFDTPGRGISNLLPPNSSWLASVVLMLWTLASPIFFNRKFPSHQK